jgi:hypothetical protein
MSVQQTKRREFIAALGGAAAWPVAANGQQLRQRRRIGLLLPTAENDKTSQSWVKALREGLQKLGWTEGGNIAIGYVSRKAIPGSRSSLRRNWQSCDRMQSWLAAPTSSKSPSRYFAT